MSAPQFMRAVRITGHGGPEVLEAAEVAVPRREPVRYWSRSVPWP